MLASYRRHRRPVSLLLCVLVSIALGQAPRQALASSGPVHRWLTAKALRNHVPLGPLTPPTEDQLVQFYLWLGQQMAAPSPSPERDGNDPTRFQKRYPNPRAFDAFGIRGFLGLSRAPTPDVWGLEDFDREDAPDRLNTIVKGSAQPDVDKRNQGRLAYDEARKPILLRDGSPAPADPAILNMGEVQGLSSQAHAHYQLAADHPSQDPDVLQREPWNFVIPAGFDGPVITTAADMAQMHLDMAILAWTWTDLNPNSGGEYISVVWASAGLHYVQDAAGQLHNIQVGSWSVFRYAKLRWYWEAMRTGGGVLEPLPTFVSIGMDLLNNLHLLAERWLEQQLDALRMDKPAAAALAAAWTQSEVDDPELMAALGDRLAPHMSGPFTAQPWEAGDGAASILVHTLAQLGSREGAQMYDAALAAVGPRAKTVGLRIVDGAPMQPGDFGDPQDGDVQRGIQALDRLHAKALRRATTATQLYWKAFGQGNADAAARRLRRFCLNRLEAEEARVATFLKTTPAKRPKTETIAWVLPAEIGAAVLGLFMVGVAVRRRLKRRQQAATRVGT